MTTREWAEKKLFRVSKALEQAEDRGDHETARRCKITCTRWHEIIELLKKKNMEEQNV